MPRAPNLYSLQYGHSVGQIYTDSKDISGQPPMKSSPILQTSLCRAKSKSACRRRAKRRDAKIYFIFRKGLLAC